MRKIIHVDMDCFYAAVEEKFQPRLKGKPVGIGGPPQSRSVLCTANYEARKFGVRAAMPSSRAVRLCPHLILIPPHFSLYKEESRKIHAIFERFTTKIEPLSLDEAYLDVTESNFFHGSASLLAKEIRRLIFEETGLTASAGIAPNKFLAKVASDWQKPNGQFTIRPADIEAFMPQLKIEKIFGVGKVTASRLHNLGLQTCGDLQKLSRYELTQIFDSRSDYYYRICRGQDDRNVITHRIRKSLSVEETYAKDLYCLDDVLRELPSLFNEWQQRFDRTNLTHLVRGSFVKVKSVDFQQSTLEVSQRKYPSLKQFEDLFRQIWERKGGPLRLLGLGVRLNEGPLSQTRDLASSPSSQAELDLDSPQLSFFDVG